MNLRECYDLIVKTLLFYVDVDDKYVPIIACWVLGTYKHDQMNTYPYLYINATKGGGKTRLLRLLSFLSHKGTMNVNPSESVVFRQAAEKTAFFFDEIERISRKEKTNLRLLLNAAYKRGIKVPRSRKVPKTEDYVVEEFEVFTPIAMANIWGLDNVLQDRCITVVLDKSFNPAIVKKVELWEYDKALKTMKKDLKSWLVEPEMRHTSGLVSFGAVSLRPANIYNTFPLFWNAVLSKIIITTQNNTTTQQHQTTSQHAVACDNFNELVSSVDWGSGEIPEMDEELYELGKKIWDSDITGRQLELFLPLILIAHEVGPDVEDVLLESATELAKEKQVDELGENRDNTLLAYLVTLDREVEWIKLREITKDFKEFEDEQWINSKWMGRAVKRLKILKKRRRMRAGREIKLDWKKIEKKCWELGIDTTQEKKEEVKKSKDPQKSLKT